MLEWRLIVCQNPGFVRFSQFFSKKKKKKERKKESVKALKALDFWESEKGFGMKSLGDKVICQLFKIK